MDTNGLIEKWYRKFIRAATRWAMADYHTAEVEATAILQCILDLAMEVRHPNCEDLIDELWAVLGR